MVNRPAAHDRIEWSDGIAQRVREAIADVLIDPDFPEDREMMMASDELIVDLGADRRDVTEILEELERVFGIAIPNDDSVPWSVTVGGCVELVERLVGER